MWKFFKTPSSSWAGGKRGKQKEVGTNSFNLIVTKMSVCIFFLSSPIFFVGLGLILRFSISRARGRLLSEMLNCSEKGDDYK